MTTNGHPHRAEDFLEILRRAKRGRLKLYIGFAAGVGKTYRMLEESQALKRRGVDVALGFIETHGRADTAALVTGLEQIPRSRIEYRGVVIEEMDTAAIIARHPEIVVVDEIAHTNAPGSRNKRRYQDVVEILDAGISVIGAFNIQHLESLNDLVERVTEVKTRETVPDGFLREADQIVNLDLAVEDLLERLKGGQDLPRRKDPLGAGELLHEREAGHAARAGAARGRREPGPQRHAQRPQGSGARAAAAASAARPPRRGRSWAGSWSACRRTRRARRRCCGAVRAWPAS